MLVDKGDNLELGNMGNRITIHPTTQHRTGDIAQGYQGDV